MNTVNCCKQRWSSCYYYFHFNVLNIIIRCPELVRCQAVRYYIGTLLSTKHLGSGRGDEVRNVLETQCMVCIELSCVCSMLILTSHRYSKTKTLLTLTSICVICLDPGFEEPVSRIVPISPAHTTLYRVYYPPTGRFYQQESSGTCLPRTAVGWDLPCTYNLFVLFCSANSIP